MILPHLFENPCDFQQVTDSECYQYFNDNPSQIFSMQILKKAIWTGGLHVMLCRVSVGGHIQCGCATVLIIKKNTDLFPDGEFTAEGLFYLFQLS